MRKPRLGGLYAVTPETEDTHTLEENVRQALEGGAKVVQYRNKRALRSVRVAQARALLNLCRQFDVPLIVNDAVGLALEIDADGVHLGRNDLDVVDARAMLGAHKLIGASCYDSLKRAIASVEAGADYVAFGSVFPSVTKPNAVCAPLALITEAKQQIHVPIAAIGGITHYNAASVVRAGAEMVAVISDLFGSSDIPARARALVRAFEEVSQQ